MGDQSEDVRAVVGKVKSEGVFDEFRRNCLYGIEEQASYIALKRKVESLVEAYLSNVKWDPKMSKKTYRDELRKYLHRFNFSGDLNQVVGTMLNRRRMENEFYPAVEEVAFRHLGLDLPRSRDKQRGGTETPVQDEYTPRAEEIDVDEGAELSIACHVTQLSPQGGEENMDIDSDVEEQVVLEYQDDGSVTLEEDGIVTLVAVDEAQNGENEGAKESTEEQISTENSGGTNAVFREIDREEKTGGETDGGKILDGKNDKLAVKSSEELDGLNPSGEKIDGESKPPAGSSGVNLGGPTGVCGETVRENRETGQVVNPTGDSDDAALKSNFESKGLTGLETKTGGDRYSGDRNFGEAKNSIEESMCSTVSMNVAEEKSIVRSPGRKLDSCLDAESLTVSSDDRGYENARTSALLDGQSSTDAPAEEMEEDKSLKKESSDPVESGGEGSPCISAVPGRILCEESEEVTLSESEAIVVLKETEASRSANAVKQLILPSNEIIQGKESETSPSNFETKEQNEHSKEVEVAKPKRRGRPKKYRAESAEKTDAHSLDTAQGERSQISKSRGRPKKQKTVESINMEQTVDSEFGLDQTGILETTDEKSSEQSTALKQKLLEDRAKRLREDFEDRSSSERGSEASSSDSRRETDSPLGASSRRKSTRLKRPSVRISNVL